MYVALITADENRTKSILEKNLDIMIPVKFNAIIVEDKPLSLMTRGAVKDTHERTDILVDKIIRGIEILDDNVTIVIDIHDPGLCAYLTTALTVKIHTPDIKARRMREFVTKHLVDILLVINDDEVVCLD